MRCWRCDDRPTTTWVSRPDCCCTPTCRTPQGLQVCTSVPVQPALFFFIVKNKNKSRCFGLFFFLFKETLAPLPVKKVFFFIVVPLEFVKESARPAAVLITRVRKWLACCCCCCCCIYFVRKKGADRPAKIKETRERKKKKNDESSCRMRAALVVKVTRLERGRTPVIV